MFQLPTLQRLTAFAALLGLGGLLLWLLKLTDPEAPYAQLPQAHGEPDYYIEIAQLYRFDAQGALIQQLDTRTATNYPERQLTLLDQPLAHYHTANQQIWRISAAKAEYHTNTQLLYLEQDLVISPLNPDSAYTPEFFTHSLWVNQAQQLAYTQDPVEFISPGGLTQGQGLRLYLDTGLAELLSQVQGSYLPAPSAASAPLATPEPIPANPAPGHQPPYLPSQDS